MMSSGASAKAFASLLLALTASAAQAQQAQQLVASALPACIQHRDGLAAPTYPPSMLERKDDGEVEVELEFGGPDSAPALRVLTKSHVVGDVLDTVTLFARGLRAPCVRADGPPLRVRQGFVFSANDGRKVATTRARDVADEQRQQQLACLVQADGGKVGSIPYPREAAVSGDEGKVLVELTFRAPDRPPEAKVLASGPSRVLRNTVTTHVATLRMPCLSQPPLAMMQLYWFKLDEGARTLIRDLSLVQFLQAARNVPRGVFFDLNQMGCPFDLRVTYYQPHDTNAVRELDVSRSIRQPFLDWLSRLELNLPAARNTEVLGDTFTLSVPCTVIDL